MRNKTEDEKIVKEQILRNLREGRPLFIKDGKILPQERVVDESVNEDKPAVQIQPHDWGKS